MACPQNFKSKRSPKSEYKADERLRSVWNECLDIVTGLSHHELIVGGLPEGEREKGIGSREQTL